MKEKVYMSEKCKTEFFMPVGVRPVLKVVRVCMRGKLNTFFLSSCIYITRMGRKKECV